MGLETDTGKFKVGNGLTNWNSLVYASGIQGVQGNNGPTGPTGANGTNGPTGPTGANSTVAGPTGPTGTSGTSQMYGNSIYYNTNTVTANQTIASGTNALSVGPITINSGFTVTIASGQRWVVL